MIPVEKKREETYYVKTCIDCGEEFEVHGKDSTEERCNRCAMKHDEEIATKNLSSLVGAKIIAVDPYLSSWGFFRGEEIGEITIETTDGSKLSLRAGGYDEDRYMEVEPVLEESET